MSKHTSTREGYHFCNNATMARDGRKIRQGQEYTAYDSHGRPVRKGGYISTCDTGLHASDHPHQAYSYCQGNTVSKVIVSEIPSSAVDNDKFAGRKRKHVKVVTLNPEQRQFISFAARASLYDAVDKYIKQLVG